MTSSGDLHGLPGVVSFQRMGGEYRSLGPGIEDLFGYSAEALLSGDPPPLELVLARDRERVARHWRSQKGPATTTFRALHRAGHVVTVEERISDAGLGLWLDRGELERTRQREEAELLMRRLGELAGGIVHELNNPLAGIVNYARVAQRLAGEDARLREVADGILAEAQRMLDTADTLRSLSPRPSGEGPRAVAPQDLLRSTLGLIRAPLRDAGVRYALEPAPAELPHVAERGHGLHVALLFLVDSLRVAQPKSLTLLARRVGGHVELVLAHDAKGEPVGVDLVRDLLGEHDCELEQRGSGNAREILVRVPMLGD